MKRMVISVVMILLITGSSAYSQYKNFLYDSNMPKINYGIKLGLGFSNLFGDDINTLEDSSGIKVKSKLGFTGVVLFPFPYPLVIIFCS